MEIKYINRQTGEIITEKPPAEGLLKFLYHHPFGKTAVLPIARQKFISEWYGRKMNHSKSTRRIKEFVAEMDIDISEAAKDMSEFTSFNDFFYRKLKPESRPVGFGFVSPGDSKLLAFEKVTEVNDFFVKGRKFTLPEFLQDDVLAEKYEDGIMLILRLAPNDYHRFHFPSAGTPSEITPINGKYFSVSPYALSFNFGKIFCENKREYCILDTPDKGEIIIAPVGATMVGSIIETYSPNQKVKKGSEMGYFAFGGSSIVLLIESGKLIIDADILKNTKNKMETFVKMGETIAR